MGSRASPMPRIILRFTFLLGCLVASALGAAERPNVILILGDDKSGVNVAEAR